MSDGNSFSHHVNRLGRAQVPAITVELKSWRMGKGDDREQLAQFIIYGKHAPPAVPENGEWSAEFTVKTNGYEFTVFAETDYNSNNGTWWVWTSNCPERQLIHNIFPSSTVRAQRFLGLIRDVFLPAEIAAGRNAEWAREVQQALLKMLDDDQSSQLEFSADGTKREAVFRVRGSLEDVMRAIKEAAKLCN